MYGDPASPRGFDYWYDRSQRARRRRDFWRNVRDGMLIVAMVGAVLATGIVWPV